MIVQSVPFRVVVGLYILLSQQVMNKHNRKEHVLFIVFNHLHDTNRNVAKNHVQHRWAAETW